MNLMQPRDTNLMSLRDTNLELKKPRKSVEHTAQKGVFDVVFGKMLFGKPGKRSGMGMCLKYPELNVLYAVPNSAKRNFKAAMYMKAEGMRPGVPDLCLPIKKGKWNCLYIEMKTKSGSLSKEQKWWHEELTLYNNLVVVARSTQDAVKKLIDYLEYREVK